MSLSMSQAIILLALLDSEDEYTKILRNKSRFNIPEDTNLHQHHCEIFKPHKRADTNNRFPYTFHGLCYSRHFFSHPVDRPGPSAGRVHRLTLT